MLFLSSHHGNESALHYSASAYRIGVHSFRLIFDWIKLSARSREANWTGQHNSPRDGTQTNGALIMPLVIAMFTDALAVLAWCCIESENHLLLDHPSRGVQKHHAERIQARPDPGASREGGGLVIGYLFYCTRRFEPPIQRLSLKAKLALC